MIASILGVLWFGVTVIMLLVVVVAVATLVIAGVLDLCLTRVR